ncbi:MAG: FtsW/RodA/SpoVE family cell cycle protein, partial [Deltaproteobacteria bacterium]|nr:FtsW/RodA/SpoVE family cell cycle protein [Deltaproteobacteria bacterium]
MTLAKNLRNMDWGILAVVFLLSVIGVLNLRSALAGPDQAGFFSGMVGRQMLWYGLGAVAMAFAAGIHYQLLDRWALVLWVCAVILLVLVFFLGRTVYGSTRWLSVGPLRLQPSELTKLAVIIAVARVLGRDPEQDTLTLCHLVKP